MSKPLTEDPEVRDELERLQALRSVLERVSDAFVALDRDWRYTYVNARAAQIFGRRAEDLVGKHIWTEFPEGVGQPFHRAYERALATQQPVHLEEYYPPYDRWFENRIYPSPDGLTIYFHDITERKRAEALLACQQEVLESIARGEPLARTLDTLVRRLEARAPGLLGTVLLVDADGVHVRHGAAPSLPPEFARVIDGAAIGPAAGSCGTAAFRRAPVIVEDIATDPLWAEWRALALPHGLRACWSTPIFDAAGGVLGTFAFYYRQPGPPPPAHQRLVETATQLASIAMHRHRAEEGLRTSEEQFRETFYRASVGKVQVEPATGHLLRANPAFGGFLGYTEAELLGKTFAEITFPEDREADAAEYARLLRREIPAFTHEKRYLRKDGVVVWGQASVTMLFDAAGRPSLATAVIQDITERKRAEAERQKFFMLAESSSEFIGMCDLNLHPLYVNPAGQRMVGLPDMAAACRVNVQDYFFPEDRQFIADEFFPRVLRDGHGDVEIRLRHFQTGEPIWMFYYLFSVRDAGGTAVGWATVSRDITERKQAEAELRASEERFHQAFRMSPAGMCITRIADGTFIEVNEAFLRVFGFTRDEVIGRRSTDLHLLTAAEREKLIAAQMATGGLESCELLAHAKSGRAVNLLFSSRPLELAGEACHVTTLIDITPRKQAEDALRQSERRLRELALRLDRIREQERTAIAREIHDVLAQELTRLKIDLV